jgi:hypothetical protein
MVIRTMTLTAKTTTKTHAYRLYGLPLPLARSAAADAAQSGQQGQGGNGGAGGGGTQGGNQGGGADRLADNLTEILRAKPQLQTQLDELIENRLAQWRRQNPGPDPEQAKELERLKAAEKERERLALEEKGKYDQVVASIKADHDSTLSERQKTIETLMGEIRQDRCFNALALEATAQGAVDPSDVAALLAARMTLDNERKPMILGDDGKPLLKAGKPVTVKDLIEKHRHDKPWMYKAEANGEPSGAGGAGASGSDTGATVSDIDKEIAAAETVHKEARAKAQKTGDLGDMQASKVAAAKVQELKEKKKAAQK